MLNLSQSSTSSVKKTSGLRSKAARSWWFLSARSLLLLRASSPRRTGCSRWHLFAANCPARSAPTTDSARLIVDVSRSGWYSIDCMFRVRPAIAAVVALLLAGVAPISAQSLDSAAGFALAADVPAAEVPIASPQAPLQASELQALGPISLQPTGQNISVPLNQRVLNYIELFQGRLHE